MTSSVLAFALTNLAYWRKLLTVIYDYLSYAAGLTALPFRQYLAVTALGGIPPTMAFVAIGATLRQDLRTMLLVYGGLGVLFVVILAVEQRLNKHLRLR